MTKTLKDSIIIILQTTRNRSNIKGGFIEMKRFLVLLLGICLITSLVTSGMADGYANIGLEDGKFYYYYGGQFYEVNEQTMLYILQTRQQAEQQTQQQQQYPPYATTAPDESQHWYGASATPVPTYPSQWQQPTTQYGYNNYAYAVRKDVKVYSDENCSKSIVSLEFGQAVQITWRQQGQKIMRVQLMDGSNISGYVKIADMCKPLYKLSLRDMVFFGTTIDFSIKSYGSAVGGYRNNEEALVLYEEGDYYFIVANSGCSGWIRKNAAVEILESYQYESVNTWYWSTYKDYYKSNQVNTGSFVAARPSLNLFTQPNQASQKTGKSVKFLEQPEILEDNGEWLYVRKADGNEGYIRKAYFCGYRGTVSMKKSVYMSPFPGLYETDWATNSGGLAKKGETCLILSDWGNYYHVVTSSGKMGYVEKTNVN